MSAKTKNKELSDANATLTKINEITSVHHNILSWRIPYDNLEYNTMYQQLCESEGTECILKLFKEDEILHVFVCGENIPLDEMNQLMIIDEISGNSEPIGTEITENCVYKGKLENKNLPLKNDVLTVGFKYISGMHSTHKEVKHDENEVLSDMDELCCDLRSMYLNAIYPDFQIHVKNHTFDSHKFILSARSKFFDRLLNDGREEHRLTHECPPGILHEVLLYIYSSELKAMNTDCMMEVYKLAVHLEIDKLSEKCIDYFKRTITKDNYKQIYRLVDKFRFKNGKSEIFSIIKSELDVKKNDLNKLTDVKNSRR